MTKTFEPLKEIPIDVDHTIEQLIRPFQSIRNGLPELVKNSKDAYARNNINIKKDRIIIVILEDKKDDSKARLGVLDFAGATIEDFEGEDGTDYKGWKTWSSRTPKQRYQHKDVEAGYGNGGKSFMVAGSTQEASMHSSTNNKRTKMGFRNSYGYTPGYFFENRKKIRNLIDKNPKNSLKMAIKPYSLSYEQVENISDIWKKNNNWTLVELVGLNEIDKKWEENDIENAITTLKTHGQSCLTIETSSLYLVHNGDLIKGPLKTSELEPMDKFDEPFIYDLPEEWVDPLTEKVVKFGKNKGKLIIKTSKKALHLQKHLQPRNVIKVKSERNIVAVYSMKQLAPTNVYGRLYGELRCTCLDQSDYGGQSRKELVENTKTRAILNWIKEVCNEISKTVNKEFSQSTSFKEELEVRNRLETLREIMQDFLEPEDAFDEDIFDGEEEGSSPSPTGKKKKKKREIGEVNKIKIENEVGFISIPIGVEIPLKHEAVDINDRIVPNVHFKWESGSVSTFDVNSEGFVTGKMTGKGKVRAVDIDSGIKSEPLEVRVYDIEDVIMDLDINSLKKHEKKSLNPKAVDIEGVEPKRLALKYEILPKGHGRVGRFGYFTAGDTPGEVEIRAIYGDDKHSSVYIDILDEESESTNQKYSGGGIPYIVLCGDEAPGCTDLSKSERTYPPNPEDPTIINFDPFWSERGIIWINHESAESRRVRERTSGTGVMGKISTKTFTEFLALKCFEILKMLKAKQKISEMSENKVTPNDMYVYLATAEIECAPFIDFSYRIVDEWFNE